MRHRLHFIAICIAFAVAAPAQANEFEFLFWPTPGVEKDARFVKSVEGACGDLVVARVRRMPQPARGDKLGTDVVYELTARSKVLRTWNLPANAIPIATDGDELLFQSFNGQFYVGTNGSVRSADKGNAFPQSVETQCRLPRSLMSSGYARCHQFPRLNNTGKSLLAFQGPCT